MSHQYQLTPFYYVFSTFFFLLVVTALWALFDSLSAKRKAKYATLVANSQKKREPLLVYQIYCGVLVVVYLLQQIFSLVPVFGADFLEVWRSITAYLVLLALPVVMAYLLRVVFPAPPKAKSIVADAADIENVGSTDEESQS